MKNNEIVNTLKSPVVWGSVGLNVVATFFPKFVLQVAKFAVPILVVAAIVMRAAEKRGKGKVVLGYKASVYLDSLLLTLVIQAAFIDSAILTSSNPSTVDSNGRKIARALMSSLVVGTYLHFSKESGSYGPGSKSLNQPKPGNAALTSVTKSGDGSLVTLADGNVLKLSSRQTAKAKLNGFIK